MAKRPKDARFEREVELLRHSPHPSIPRFEDAGQWTAPDGQRYPYVVIANLGPAMNAHLTLTHGAHLGWRASHAFHCSPVSYFSPESSLSTESA
jgi:serine/threonine protein kinase